MNYAGKYAFAVNTILPNKRYVGVSEAIAEDSDNLYFLDRQTRFMKVRSKPIRRTNYIDGGVVWNSVNTEFYLASKLKRNFPVLMSFTVDGVFFVSARIVCWYWTSDTLQKNNDFLILAENNVGFSEIKIKHVKTNKFVRPPQILQGAFH
jgi:hypothetical protein